MAEVTIFEHANFQGRSRTLGEGKYQLVDANDMNDMVSSLKVPPGLVAFVYEHADSGGGFGIAADFLEDCADLSQFGLNDQISYITVFAAQPPTGFIWARNAIVDGQFVSGHWERKRASGALPPNAGVVVSPPIPAHDLGQPVVTSGGTPAVADSDAVRNHVIPAFVPFPAQARWDMAVKDQMGIIGSDYRGIEKIGSAAFERASNNLFIPDSFNFWYPQKQPNDHRDIVYFKRTLAGKLLESHISKITGTFPDADLNINIEPTEGYQYLITEGHPREYTDIMSAEYTLSAHQHGQPDCDDDASKAEFTFIEAEIDFDARVKEHFNQLLQQRKGKSLCVYGVWMYDKGHCCHSEIHPAEQIWWSEPLPGGQVYACNVFVDESKRFWWRNQMDDGTKLKPWGAPPITGTFAIAFETVVNAPAKQFNIQVQDAFNHVTAAEPFQRHHLVYQNNTLIAVVQDPGNLVRVSFEDVGLVGANTVRGFVVIETTVGKCTQHPNPIMVSLAGSPPIPINLPADTDPNKVDQMIERLAFTKESGRMLAMIVQGVYQSGTVSTVLDLNGNWSAGGRQVAIATQGNALTIDMTAFGRPAAFGTIVDSSTITVTFPDDATFTGKLLAPNSIRWSNGTAWTTGAVSTVLDLNGNWSAGGRRAVIAIQANALTIDMSAFGRPAASGSIVDGSTITVTFPDDKTFTGKLQAPNMIRWSNGTAWTK